MHRNINKATPERIQHNPIDDLESSIWVLLWELYTQASKLGSNRLSQRQLEVFTNLRHHESWTVFFAKSETSRHVTDAIPQCPPLNKLVSDVLALTAKVHAESILMDDVFERFYQDYFVAFLDCTESREPSLNQRWDCVFPVPQPDTADHSVPTSLAALLAKYPEGGQLQPY